MKWLGPALAAALVIVAIVFAQIRPSHASATPANAPSTTGGATPPENRGGGGGGFFGGGGGTKNVDYGEAVQDRVAEIVSAPGTIRPGSDVAIGAPFEGRILELAVDEGAAVKPGDLIFRLDPVEWQDKLKENELDLARKTAALAEAKQEETEATRKAADATKEPSTLTEARLRRKQASLEKDRAEAQLASAEARLALAKAKLDMNVGSKVDVDAAETERNVSGLNRKIAEEALSLAVETETFRERSWKDDRATAEKTAEVSKTRRARGDADLNAAQVAVERAKRDLERTWVRSPLKGVVTARNVNTGELVTRGGNGRTADSIAHYIVSDMGRMLVYADVEEGDVAKLAPEQVVRTRVNALGESVRLPGRVLDVAYRAARKDDLATFTVRVLLDAAADDGDGDAKDPLAVSLKRLRPSMTASIEIETRAKPNAVLVPLPSVVRRKKKDIPEAAWAAIDPKVRELKKPDETQDVVFVVKGNKVEIRAVTLGLSDAERIEVEKGVAAGEAVVVGPYRTLEALQPGDKVKATKKTEPGKDGKDAPIEGGGGKGKG